MTMLRVASGTVGGIRVAVRGNTAHLGFDPRLRLLVDLGFAHAGSVESGADTDGDGTRFLQEGLARPQFSGIVGDGYHLAANVGGQVGAARLVALGLPRGDAGAFGEEDDVEALLEPLATLGNDLVERVLAGGAVDGNHLHRRQAPADKRHLEQFLLQHEDTVGTGRHAILQGHRFPGRLVLGEYDAGFRRHVFAADYLGANAQDILDTELGAQSP